MNAIRIVLSNIKTIFRHPYNKRYPFKAIFRYFRYLGFKISGRPKRIINVWDNRKLFWYRESIQSIWLMFNYIIDWEEFNLIRRSVKDNSVFIDVGANVGYYTIWASQFNPNGKIYSFEPNDLNFERLQENISCNNLNAQISSVKKAVAATHGFISMTADLDTLNHIIKEGNIVSNTMQVECISLDDFAAQESILYIDYLKIDVEGFELEVLFGAKELILENKIGIIQLEINNALSHSGHSSYEVVDFFKEHNYKLCSYDVIKGKLIEINYSPDRENYFAVNYLAFERK